MIIIFIKYYRLFGTPQPRTLYFLVEAKSRVREVYAQTCHHFSKQGMLDTELFGLAVLIGKFILNLSNILFGKINNKKPLTKKETKNRISKTQNKKQNKIRFVASPVKVF